MPGDEVPKIDKFRYLLSSGSFVGVLCKSVSPGLMFYNFRRGVDSDSRPEAVKSANKEVRGTRVPVGAGSKTSKNLFSCTHTHICGTQATSHSTHS